MLQQRTYSVVNVTGSLRIGNLIMVYSQRLVEAAEEEPDYSGHSSKQHRRQVDVAADVAQQIAAGETRISGVMIESHLHEGRQDIVEGQALQYGVSLTDACISMEQTIPVLEQLAAAVRARRSKNA